MKQRKWIALLCAAALVLSCAGYFLPVQTRAVSSAELLEQIEQMEEQNQQLQEEIDALEQQKLDNFADMEVIIRQKSDIDRQVTLLSTQMRVTEDQIAAYSALIAEKQAELDAAQANLAELTEWNRDRIRAMEENGSLSYWSVLFKANSFSDLLDRLNMIEEIAAADIRRLEEMDLAAKEVELAQQSLLEQKAGLEQTRAELAENQAVLEEKRLESETLLQALVAKGEEYRQRIDEGEAKLEEWMQELAEKEVEYDEALQREWEAAHPQPEYGGGGSAPPNEGGWVVPCSYVYVSSPFSDGRLHPILGYVRPHNGIDLAAYQGNPVYATRSGVVSVADYQWDGAGNYVLINHGDGFSSIYMHMEEYVVSSGEYVSAGQVIGYVGSTGLSDGPHLHFGISYYGTYVNPADYIYF